MNIKRLHQGPLFEFENINHPDVIGLTGFYLQYVNDVIYL